MSELSDDELLEALGVAATPIKTGGRTARQERIVAGFEEVVAFFEVNRRAPRHDIDGEIFERLYAIRLDQLRSLPDALELLKPLDLHGLLEASALAPTANTSTLDDEALLAELGLQTDGNTDDITVLKHVQSFEERQAAEEIANRIPCKDFATFKRLIAQAELDLKNGVRLTKRFVKDASIELGSFFVLGGQFAYVAEVGDIIKNKDGHTDARLRVIYSNGTESNLLQRSLQKALYKDEAGRRLTDPSAGPLFSEDWADEDIESGTIYVLRSHSKHPYVVEHRELIHKIGVTGGKVETRIANAALDATYLLADVEVVATYKLAGINRTKLEKIFHRIFSAAQLQLAIPDRFGNAVQPREWFLVPLQVIDKAVEYVRDGSITDFVYDPKVARLVKQPND
jgi:T5orf172 domain